MFTGIRNLYGALGVMLFLIALYLVLERGAQASTVIAAVAKGTGDIFTVLQGRSPGGSGAEARRSSVVLV